MRTFIVGSRKSKLALIQTKGVVERLEKLYPMHRFVVKNIETLGDKEQHVALGEFRQTGVFTSDLEQALAAETVDFAVHSLKDLPIVSSPSFPVVAYVEREDARDAFISRHHVSLGELAKDAVIGTSSARRAAQIKVLSPQICSLSIRGAIDHRLQQLADGRYDGIILAVAGLNRLQLQASVTAYLPVDQFTPAAGQGALALQCRKGDREMIEILQALNDAPTALATEIEREFVAYFDKSAQEPIGAYAACGDTGIVFYTSMTSPDGREAIQHKTTGIDKVVVLREAIEKMVGALSTAESLYLRRKVFV